MSGPHYTNKKITLAADPHSMQVGYERVALIARQGAARITIDNDIHFQTAR
ncbi:MAG TPA: hypothetical protein VK104_02270 [Burkholderiaceae bacterium]|nr:hypothetical protein [Burkholderiaceae bacterium]